MNSQLQNKLQQFSATPPEEVWNKVAGALDAEEGLAQRLSAYEEEPSAANWQKIEQQLSRQTETGKLVPLRNRFSKPLRYIAVASLLAVTLVTLTLTLKRTEAGALESDGTSIAPATSLPVGTTSPQTHTDEQPDPATQPPHNNEVVQGSQARTTTADKAIVSPASINAAQQDYVSYSDGNGNVVKVSRKMENFINCSDSDWACKQRLQELRQKMAAKATTTDFTGILEMLQQLQ